MCHCFAEAVRGRDPLPSTACRQAVAHGREKCRLALAIPTILSPWRFNQSANVPNTSHYPGAGAVGTGAGAAEGGAGATGGVAGVCSAGLVTG